jgi:hypothetical protein
VDCSRKSVFRSIAETGDSRLQASRELFSSTLDARTLLPEMGAAIIARLVNLSELTKRHQAWK